MDNDAFDMDALPDLTAPVMIAGFKGWGNALEVAHRMAAWLDDRLAARPFARLMPDLFYRYDEERPVVSISEGRLTDVDMPGGSVAAIAADGGGVDLVVLQATEPQLNWQRFTAAFIDLCLALRVSMVITLGSMFDNVLHTDRIISAMASSPGLLKRIRQHDVRAISYQGPSAVHTLLQQAGQDASIPCLSLWCHCPFYLQNTVHFGMMAHLGRLLGTLTGIEVPVDELQAQWGEVEDQIQQLMASDPKVAKMISRLRQEKVRGNWQTASQANQGDNVISLKDFLETR